MPASDMTRHRRVATVVAVLAVTASLTACNPYVFSGGSNAREPATRYEPPRYDPPAFEPPPASAPERPAVADSPWGGLPWNEATGHVGSVQRVCGPLRSQRPWNDSVFFNLGRDYPDTGRFTIVLWDVGGVETLRPGVTLCAEGLITTYEGVTQMEFYDTSVIEIWE